MPTKDHLLNLGKDANSTIENSPPDNTAVIAIDVGGTKMFGITADLQDIILDE